MLKHAATIALCLPNLLIYSFQIWIFKPFRKLSRDLNLLWWSLLAVWLPLLPRCQHHRCCLCISLFHPHRSWGHTIADWTTHFLFHQIYNRQSSWTSLLLLWTTCKYLIHLSFVIFKLLTCTALIKSLQFEPMLSQFDALTLNLKDKVQKVEWNCYLC